MKILYYMDELEKRYREINRKLARANTRANKSYHN